MPERKIIGATLFVVSLALQTLACGSKPNPNVGRTLISIAVTPEIADAQNFPNGQVQFTATGTFSLPPTPDLVTFAPPYSGQFTMSDTTIATVVSTGQGTITAQCVAGASGTVFAVASASSNSTLMSNVVVSA